MSKNGEEMKIDIFLSFSLLVVAFSQLLCLSGIFIRCPFFGLSWVLSDAIQKHGFLSDA